MTMAASLICCWMAALAFGQPADAAPDAVQQARSLRQQLTLEKVKTVPQQAEGDLSSALSQLAAEIAALQAPQAATAQTPTAAAPQRPAASDAAAPTAPVVIDPQAVWQRLKSVQNPVSPMSLADVLYRGGQFELAYAFYQRALQAAPSDDAAGRAWALFQSANCLRQTDPAKAIAWYAKLLELYPNCLWAPMAKAQQKWLDWQIKNFSDLSRYDAKAQR